MWLRSLRISILFLGVGLTAFGQDSIPAILEKDPNPIVDSRPLATTTSSFNFIKMDENRIHNSVSLSDFYETLFKLKQNQAYKVQIIHIGDSHIQADYLTRRVRQNFQSQFGNAGRGLIFPGRVAKTNEPPNIITSSTSIWETKRMVNPELPLPIGIGGITLRTIQPNANLAVKTIDTPPLSYAFNKITLFFQKDISSFHMVVKDSANEDIAFIGAYTYEPYPNTSSVLLPFSTHQFILQMLPSTSMQTQATIFGVSLENSKPGILYHVVGVNGAKFKNYVDSPMFVEQTAVLAPDLIIISLGTNEALDYPYLDPQFTNSIDALVTRMKNKNPNARILFTTPPDAFKRRTRRNPGVEVVRDKIIDYAEKHNLAYWDLYTIGGGKHSADLWKKSRLMRSDGIHFFAAGYDLQGSLLYDALMKGYEEYVQYRHP